MLTHLRPAITLLVLLTFVTGFLYPVAITWVAQFAVPHQANGSLVRDSQGRVVGSALIGQSFKEDRYFHGRPSAAGQNGYDAVSSSGSNLGPLSKKLIERVQAEAEALVQAGATRPLPADSVTASASGLDPHISPEFAYLQARRVARARGLDEAAVRGLIARHTEEPVLGFIGERRVNVLLLNLDLDAAGGGSRADAGKQAGGVGTP